MQGQINADLSTMPFKNMALLFGGAALLIIIAGIVIVTVAQKLRIKSFGPFKMEHNNTSALYDMNEKIKDFDDHCHRQMRYITDRMKIHIANILDQLNICIPARVSISSAIRFPLYESIANNHFTVELMPDRYQIYRGRIIDNMRDEYESISGSKDTQCNRDRLPPWDEMSNQIIGCIDLWLKRVSKEVMDCCEKKITVYKNYLRSFEKTDDDFRTNICKDCIEKNERYVRELKRLI